MLAYDCIQVVATPKGIEELIVEIGKDILIAEKAEDLSVGIDRLLTDRHLSAKLGKRGWEVVNTHYSWKTIMQNIHNALLKCVTAKSK